MIDYIRRAMPFGNAQSLTNDELYAVTAYMLYLNDIIKDERFELNERNFAAIRMPERAGFPRRRPRDVREASSGSRSRA